MPKKRYYDSTPLESVGAGEEVPVDTSVPLNLSVEEIEKFIIDVGSDDIPTFGGEKVGGVYIQQIPDEIAPCLWRILSTGKGVNSYLEVGVASGGMTYVMNHLFKPKTIVLIDTNDHPRCVNRPQVLKGVKYEEVIGKSGDTQVFDQVVNLGYAYDSIMIDGVHYYENVKKDVELYAPLLNPGGFLMLHDSVLYNWGVPKVVAELKLDDRFVFINEWSSKKMTPCGVALFRRAQ